MTETTAVDFREFVKDLNPADRLDLNSQLAPEIARSIFDRYLPGSPETSAPTTKEIAAVTEAPAVPTEEAVPPPAPTIDQVAETPLITGMAAEPAKTPEAAPPPASAEAKAEPVEQTAPVERAETAAETPAAVPEQEAPPVARTAEQIIKEAKQALEKKGRWSSELKPDEVGVFIKELIQPLGLTANTVSLGDTFSTATDFFSTVTANGVSDNTQTTPIKLETLKIQIISPKAQLGVIRAEEISTDTDPAPAGFDSIKDKINDQIGGDKIIQGLESATARLLEIDPEKYIFLFTLLIDSQTDKPILHFHIGERKTTWRS